MRALVAVAVLVAVFGVLSVSGWKWDKQAHTGNRIAGWTWDEGAVDGGWVWTDDEPPPES